MKIHQLISNVYIPLTNEETDFVRRHTDKIRLESLDDHNLWVAQNLVRKGIYQVSKDSKLLVKNLHD
jgi:hypothetical protein